MSKVSASSGFAEIIRLSPETPTTPPPSMSPYTPSTNPTGDIFCEELGNPVIEMTEVSKRFGFGGNTKSVLIGVNLSIMSNQIFVIYGAKGSGKSTLLKVMLGLMKPTFGLVQYNLPGGKRRIRYVPQQDGLYMNCTVKENLNVFGKLSGFKNERISELYHELYNRLGMPQSDLLLENMTENQVMRISFFIGTMSQPDILVIDEGTSNVDPIFKHEMWTQMRYSQRTHHTTIILASCDSEECQRGDCVAFLRGGRIISTGAPEALLARSPTMEKVFRHVAAQSEEMDNNEGVRVAGSSTFSEALQIDLSREEWLNKCEMKQHFSRLFPCPASYFTIFATLLREKILSTWHNKFFYLFIGVILPNLVLIAFYYGIGHEVDNAAIGLRKCEACQLNVNFTRMAAYCSIYKAVQLKFLIIKVYESDETLIDALYQGKLRATVSFNFEGADPKNIEYMESHCKRKKEPEWHFDFIPVRIVVDASVRSLLYDIRQLVESVKLRKVKPHSQRKFSMPVEDELKNRDSLFVIENAFYNVLVDAHTIVWGIAIMIVFHFGVLVGVWPLLNERSNGLLDRLRVLGLKLWHFEANRVFDIVIVWLGSILLISVTQFLHTMSYKPGGVHLIMFIFGLSGMTTGMLLAVLLNNAFYINMVMMAVNFVALILSGALWPQDALTALPFYVSLILPHTHVVQGVQSYIFRDFGFGQFVVVKAIWVPVVWLLGTYTIYLLVSHRNWK